MDLKFYIPISKYLNESDFNPKKAKPDDKFTFIFTNEKVTFGKSQSSFVLKSLSYFL
jgi:hypothetical protein